VKSETSAPVPKRPRILFVDDEEGIRCTLALLLEKHGFDVTAVGTVADALTQITCLKFDALLADLNIHRESDGFIVISAMRQKQPNCRNFVLTGYPCLENAIKAIQNQADDYFSKPVEIGSLARRIQEKLAAPERTPGAAVARLAAVLREHSQEITKRILDAINRDRIMAQVPLSDDQRVDHLPAIFTAMTEQLESKGPALKPDALHFAAKHGERRKKDGYPVSLVIKEFQLIGETVYELLQSESMPLGAIGLTAELWILTKSLNSMMLESVQAYTQTNEHL
jgi:ActR/RegA family two-component response regulator